MCGFLGKFSFSDFDSTDINSANKKILCRGPDNTSELVNYDNQVKYNLRFNRLSILDLNDIANQPMTSLDSRNIIMFNGEIFNHSDLRKKLKSIGANFKTDRSDTEVVLNGLKIKGLNFINELRGQFAIFYFDKANKKIYLVRDRLGQKPLYYSITNYEFIFGSNLQSVKQLTETYSIENNQVNNYLKYGSIGRDKTLYNSIKKVLPSEIIEVDYNSGSFKTRQYSYWEIFDNLDNKKFDKEEFFSTFNEAVSLRMEADVPIAHFLSGGLDSSSIVKSTFDSGFDINTFTVKSNNEKYNEGDWAEFVSKKYKTNHSSVNINEEISFKLIENAVSSLDEPYSDPSVVPSFLISNEMSKNYKVAISGDGGDELLGGYQRTKLSLLKKSYLSEIYTSLYKIYPSFLGTGNRLLSKSRNLSTRYKSFLEDLKLLDLLKVNHDLTDDYIDFSNSSDNLKTLLIADYKFYLPDMMMYKIDRTSMANSLEIRSPLVDHKLVEYVLSRDVSFIEMNKPKLLFRTYLETDLGTEYISRPKQGFVFDIENWIYQNQSFFYEFIMNSNLNNFMEMKNIRLLYLNKSRINALRIWKLYVLSKFI